MGGWKVSGGYTGGTCGRSYLLPRRLYLLFRVHSYSLILTPSQNSFLQDGRKINVGDCALFTPSHDSLPFVGRIRKLIVGKENSLSLSVNWLYRPADVKLKDGALLEAAPNEIFYSFHKDEIPVASLLHPCKVTFLRKGVELPSGISSFVCRRVYDIESQCLWWLTDKDYINERQEEVNQLLDKTRIEMHGAVQTGGRSPKPVNGPNGSAQLKHSSDNVQNSSSSISSHAKSRKREHGVHNSDSVKRERLSKVDDADSGQLKPDHNVKTKIAKITDKGGLIDFGGVEKLIQLMRPDSAEKKLDLASRTMLVDVISVTDRFDCLERFVQIRGLSVLDEWLQEIHKGKIGDCSLKVIDKSVEEFIFSLLRALDRLPVNLHALQTCNVGKSVNHLRSHKNSEIQKKARSLVSTWKRRVEAEMNIIVDNGNSPRLIMRLPNTSRSPARTVSVESPQDSSTISGKASLPVPSEKQDSQKVSGKIDSLQINNVLNTGADFSRVKDGLAGRDEERGSSSGITPIQPEKLYEASYSSINALVESCAKFSEASVSPSVGDDVGINLLASVATGEMSRSDVSPACSPVDNSPLPEESCSVNAAKLILLVQDEDNISLANGHSVDSLSTKGESNRQVPHVGTHISGDSKDTSFGCEVKTGADNIQLDSPVMIPEVKPIGLINDTNGCKDDDEKPRKNNVVQPDVAVTSAKVETQINEESTSWSSSDMHEDENNLVHKRSSSSNLAATSCGDVNLEPTSKDADNKKAEIHDEQSEKQNMDSGTSDSQHSSEHAQEDTEKDEKVSSVARQEIRLCEKPTDVAETSYVAEMAVMLDFDLNEVVPSEDGIQGEVEKSCIPNTPSPLPFSSSPVNGNQPALITVASAAKGPFYPSENLLRGKAELGWKGSAATSAFRPAEPRKVDIPVPDNHTSKKARPLLDFDLNVGVIEDAIQQNAPSFSGGGLDLNLNACEESHEAVQLSVSSSIRHPWSLPSGVPSSSRGFDLNNRTGVEEVGGESVTFSKNSVQFMSGVSNVKMNNMDIGNYSTWFTPNNTYPAITIPSQRMSNPATPSSSVNPEMFRGPVLPSSPAVAFPPTVPFQYSAFPFETNFSLPSVSNTFSSLSNPYVDSSSSGGIPCFPSIPSVGPMPYRPHFMSLPGGSTNVVGPDGRKLIGSQGLDLNAGPGGGGSGTDDKLPSTLRHIPLQDERLKMFQQMTSAAGSGISSKRKEPDGCWDGDRITYKHPSQQ